MRETQGGALAVVMRPGARTVGSGGGGGQISRRHLLGLLTLDDSCAVHTYALPWLLFTNHLSPCLMQLLKEPANKAAFNLIHMFFNLLVLCYGLDCQVILALLQALLCLVAA